jgi:predicted nucleic acid-binding protein
MDPAFWDSSSLVPLCVVQAESSRVRQLSASYRIHVWWSAPVEVRSAIARLSRMGVLSQAEIALARNVLSRLKSNWLEVLPSATLRDDAEDFVDRFQLRAADAQQLAAANDWALGRPSGRVFISGDVPLLEAARQLGFQTIQA